MAVGNPYGLQCPKCKSKDIWSVGFIPTSEGRKARFKCTWCATSFYKDAPGALVPVKKVRKPRIKKVIAPVVEVEKKVRKSRAKKAVVAE